MSKNRNPNISEELAETLEEQRDERFEKVRQRYRILVILLLIPIILLAIRTGKQPVVLVPDYPQVETEPNAFPSHDDEEKFQVGQGGGAVALIYSDQVIYNLSTGRISLSYTNPSSSTASIILQIVLLGPDGSEYLLAQSGRLNPGYAVERLDSDMDENLVLSQGVYSGEMRLLFYNPETGEKALVDTKIPVTITVQ